MYAIRPITADEFPPLLNEITDPPQGMYIAGTLPPHTYKLLCVVGSRKYSPYAKDACEFLIRALRGYPVAIVSGLAIGIDSIAHRAALEAGLPTIAVPGSGLSPQALYPASHYQLACSVIKHGGALLSEFAPDFRATPWSFPQRNRIMAGMSHTVLVVEAGEKSGTLITARLALDYNRDVLVVPHPIFNAGARGGQYLLKNGAGVVTSGADIIDALGIEAQSPEDSSEDSSLSPQEMEVLSHLSEPRSRDKLAQDVSFDIQTLNQTLTILEIKGFIKESMGLIHKT